MDEERGKKFVCLMGEKWVNNLTHYGKELSYKKHLSRYDFHTHLTQFILANTSKSRRMRKTSCQGLPINIDNTVQKLLFFEHKNENNCFS